MGNKVLQTQLGREAIMQLGRECTIHLFNYNAYTKILFNGHHDGMVEHNDGVNKDLS